MGVTVLEEKCGDAVEFVGIIRHVLPAMMCLAGRLVTWAVRDWVDWNRLAAFAVPECVIQGVQFPVNRPFPCSLLDPLLAPVAVLVAGGIRNRGDVDPVPEFQQDIGVTFLVRKGTSRSRLQISVEIAVLSVATDNVPDRNQGWFRIRVFARANRAAPSEELLNRVFAVFGFE